MGAVPGYPAKVGEVDGDEWGATPNYFSLFCVPCPAGSDDKVEERYRQYLTQQAREQLEASLKGRWSKVNCMSDSKGGS